MKAKPQALRKLHAAQAKASITLDTMQKAAAASQQSNFKAMVETLAAGKRDLQKHNATPAWAYRWDRPQIDKRRWRRHLYRQKKALAKQLKTGRAWRVKPNIKTPVDFPHA